jgi:hypothetical protein
MTGRRRNARFEIANAEGVLRLFTDVSVSRGGAREFVAVGDYMGWPGEFVTIHIAGAGDFPARVIDSRPVIINGSMLHRVRLEPKIRDHSLAAGDAVPGETK